MLNYIYHPIYRTIYFRQLVPILTDAPFYSVRMFYVRLILYNWKSPVRVTPEAQCR